MSGWHRHASVRRLRTCLLLFAAFSSISLPAPPAAAGPVVDPIRSSGVLAALAADQVGVVDQSQGLWSLRDGDGGTFTFYFGNPGDVPFAGDWDCDGVDTPGLYRQSDGYVYLRNSNTQGIADVSFFFGNPGDVPIAGDFNNNGCDTVSIYRPSQGRVFIIDKLGSEDAGLGAAELDYYFGNPGDSPFTGDFNNDGTDTVGLYRESTGSMYFRNSHTQGNADFDFFFGNPGDRFVGGDWTGDGTDTPGVFRPSDAFFYLKYTNTQGNADEAFAYGTANSYPVAGKWGNIPAIPPMSFTRPSDGDTVFHTEAVAASVGDESGGTVDLLVDGAKVGSGAIKNGSVTVDWDTTTVADGSHSLELIATFASGGVARAGIDVEVANQLSGDGRIGVDYDQGTIGVDEFSFYDVTALTLPDVLPARYAAEVDFEAEGTPFDFGILDEKWDELDPSTRQQVMDYLAAWETLDEGQARRLALEFQNGPLAPAAVPTDSGTFSPASFPLNDWKGCEIVLEEVDFALIFTRLVERVRCTVDSTNFEIEYELLGGQHGIPENQDDGVETQDTVGRINATVSSGFCNTTYTGCNGVPDYIDEALASMEWAVAEYTAAGYRSPPKNVVKVHGGRAQAILPVWDFLLSGDIHLDPDNDQFSVARHEVFHTIQYTYTSSLLDWQRLNVWWWGEATANWATREFQPSNQAGAETGYFADLPSLLGRPNRALNVLEEDAFGLWFILGMTRRARKIDDIWRRSQYGSFILAEWLNDYSLPTTPTKCRDSICRSWEILGEPDSRDALQAIAAAVGRPLDDVVFSYHVGSYLMQRDGVDLHPDVQGWRGRLQSASLPGENETVGGGFGANNRAAPARPARIRQPIVPNGSAEAPSSALRSLEPGGAAYAEMELPAGSGELTVTVPSSNVFRFALVLFDGTGYPNLCRGGDPRWKTAGIYDERMFELNFADIGGGMMAASLDYEASCRYATLVVSSSQPLTQTPVVVVDQDAKWTITHEPKGVLVANTGDGIWEWDGAVWSQLASAPFTFGDIGDIIEYQGDIYARMFDRNGPTRTIRRLNDDGSWTIVKTFGVNESPGALAVGNDRLYVIVGAGPDPRRTRLLRYEGGSAWTTVVDRVGWAGGVVAMTFAGKEELVLVTQVDFVGLNPTQSQIWLHSEVDGLRQASFDTPDGPVSRSSPRFGISDRAHASLGAEQLLGRSGGSFGSARFLVSTDGTTWSTLDAPKQFSIFVMETHEATVHFSGWSADDMFGTTELPIRVYDGTTTRTLVDPPDMAWWTFVADDGELYMAGYRDVDSGPVVEQGVYRLVDEKRVSISDGTPMAGEFVSELLVRSDT